MFRGPAAYACNPLKLPAATPIAQLLASRPPANLVVEMPQKVDDEHTWTISPDYGIAPSVHPYDASPQMNT